MLDVNRHKYFMLQILKDVYSDPELAANLGFKGGTALMLFYGLPRFSVDLDFNIIKPEKEKLIFSKVKKILSKHGEIKDEALKYYGIVLVLNYGEKERNLKVEISSRIFNDSYEIKNFLGINMKVMKVSDMFAHKISALTDRNVLVNRDIYDCHFFLKNKIILNNEIVEIRMNMPVKEYLEKCITILENKSNTNILDGLGDLVDPQQKKFIKNNLLSETIQLLRIYSGTILKF